MDYLKNKISLKIDISINIGLDLMGGQNTSRCRRVVGQLGT